MLFEISILCFGGLILSMSCVLCSTVLCWRTLSLHLCLFVLCVLFAHADLGRCSVAESICIVFIVVLDDIECLAVSMRKLTIIPSLDLFANLNDDIAPPGPWVPGPWLLRVCVCVYVCVSVRVCVCPGWGPAGWDLLVCLPCALLAVRLRKSICGCCVYVTLLACLYFF